MFIHGQHRELIFFIETVIDRRNKKVGDKLNEKCAVNYMNKQGMILSRVPYSKAENSPVITFQLIGLRLKCRPLYIW